MIDSGDLPGLDMPNVDAHSDLGHLGSVEMHHPTQDLSGDGLPDTETVEGTHSMDVWTDMDHDGFADHLTVVDNDGDYSAWEFHHNSDGTTEWVRTEQGRIGK
jgi:arginine deiminase